LSLSTVLVLIKREEEKQGENTLLLYDVLLEKCLFK
jgi:hypothetical protein